MYHGPVIKVACLLSPSFPLEFLHEQIVSRHSVGNAFHKFYVESKTFYSFLPLYTCPFVSGGDPESKPTLARNDTKVLSELVQNKHPCL